MNRLLMGIMAVLIVIMVASPIIVYNSTQAEITATVKEKTVKRDSQKSEDMYLVFTDKEVLKNTDSLLALKFNSSDLYGQLDAGQKYTFKVYGFRVPFLSMYRNIVKFEKVQ